MRFRSKAYYARDPDEEKQERAMRAARLDLLEQRVERFRLDTLKKYGARPEPAPRSI